MRKGFVLISTLALIVILSFLILVISRLIYNDTIKSTVYTSSIEKRIELINSEKLFTNTLLNNSELLKNLTFAESQLNIFANTKYENLDIELYDMTNCFNLNTLVKPFRSIYVKNEDNGLFFENLLLINNIDRTKHRELIDRLYDALDSDRLPEPFGAEDLFYTTQDELSLNPDQLFLHKSQIKNLAMLTTSELELIYKNICALPDNDVVFNINELNNENYQVLLSIYPDLSLKDIETIILSKPIEGYQNFSNLLELTNITAFKLTEDYLTFEPKYIQILYKVKYEDTFFNLLSIITLESRNNNIIRKAFQHDLYIFTDTSLSKCVSITNQKAKYTDFSNINLKDDIHVILPNEILMLVSNDNEMTNKSNIQASIINTIATNSLKDTENLKILETSNSHLYHVISAENLLQLKQIFSAFDGNLKISSDLSYFKKFKHKC